MEAIVGFVVDRVRDVVNSFEAILGFAVVSAEKTLVVTVTTAGLEEKIVVSLLIVVEGTNLLA